MANFLIFAGTTEGRMLVQSLCRAAESEDLKSKTKVFACVATEYGKKLLEQGLRKERGQCAAEAFGEILCGRLSEEEMSVLMETQAFDLVIDATHPYATVVTETIQRACTKTLTPYLRLLREKGNLEAAKKENTVFVEDVEQAVSYLNSTKGIVFLTTGSKELERFTGLNGYRERLFVRVLPIEEGLKKCRAMGLSGRQIICMQGPFSYEMNRAMFQQVNANYLVTKDSGKTGGFEEKIEAAEALGMGLVIIGRKKEETGKDFSETISFLTEQFGLSLTHGPKCDIDQKEQKADWFPLFTKIERKNVVVVGAGAIGERRIQTLLEFSCNLTVIAKEASEAVKAASKRGELCFQERAYRAEDLVGADYVIAATDDRKCNQNIVEGCRERKIPVNTVDCKEQCDFYFPGVVRRNDVVVGVTASGKNHRLAGEVAKRIRLALKELE